MIIDSHQHVNWHYRDAKTLVEDLDANGIEQAWLLSWEVPTEEDNTGYHGVLDPVNVRADGTHAGILLKDLLATQAQFPSRFVVGYCPYPLHPAAPKLFESAYHIHGVRVCGEWKFRVLFDDPRCLNLYRKAGELGCPVVLHLDVPYLKNEQGESVYQPLWYGGTVANLERALQACPQTNFIGHAPGFWREISGDADDVTTPYPMSPVTPGGRLHGLFDKYPNLYADISAGSGMRALSRDPQHAQQFITRFADRLLFGRDYYGGEHQAFLKTLELAADVRAKLMGGNAAKLLKPVTPRPPLAQFVKDATGQAPAKK